MASLAVREYLKMLASDTDVVAVLAAANDARGTAALLEGLRVTLAVACEQILSKGKAGRALASRDAAAAECVRNSCRYAALFALTVCKRAQRGELEAGLVVDANAWKRVWVQLTRIIVETAEDDCSEWGSAATALLTVFSLCRYRELCPQPVFDMLRANKAFEASLYAAVGGTGETPVGRKAPVRDRQPLPPGEYDRVFFACVPFFYIYRSNFAKYPAMHARHALDLVANMPDWSWEALVYIRGIAQVEGIRRALYGSLRDYIGRLSHRSDVKSVRDCMELYVILQQAESDAHDDAPSVVRARLDVEATHGGDGNAEHRARVGLTEHAESILWGALRTALSREVDADTVDSYPWKRLWSLALEAVLQQYKHGRIDALDLTRVSDGHLDPLVAALAMAVKNDADGVAYAQMLQCILDDPRRTRAFDVLYSAFIGPKTAVTLMKTLVRVSVGPGVDGQRADSDVAILLRALSRTCELSAPLNSNFTKIEDYRTFATMLMRHLARTFGSGRADQQLARWIVRVASSFAHAFNVITLDDGHSVDLSLCERGLVDALRTWGSADDWVRDVRFVLEWVRGIGELESGRCDDAAVGGAPMLTPGERVVYVLTRSGTGVTCDCALGVPVVQDLGWYGAAVDAVQTWLNSSSMAALEKLVKGTANSTRDVLVVFITFGAMNMWRRVLLANALWGSAFLSAENIVAGIKLLLSCTPPPDEHVCDDAADFLAHAIWAQRVTLGAVVAALAPLREHPCTFLIIAIAMRWLKASAGEYVAVNEWKSTGMSITDLMSTQLRKDPETHLRRLDISFLSPSEFSARPKVACPLCQVKYHPFFADFDESAVSHLCDKGTGSGTSVRDAKANHEAPVQALTDGSFGWPFERQRASAATAPALSSNTAKHAQTLAAVGGDARDTAATTAVSRKTDQADVKGAAVDTRTSAPENSAPTSPSPSLPPSAEPAPRSSNQGTSACDESPVSRTCAACGKGDVKLLKCGGCLVVRYCSRECQKTAWPQHRKACAGRR